MDRDFAQGTSLEYYKIGGLIRRYRKEKDLKLLDLSAITGIKSALLSKIENGRMLPTIPTLFTIIQKLGLKPDVFFANLNTDNNFPGYFFIPHQQYTLYEKEETATGFEYQSILEHHHDGGAFQISIVTLKPGAKRALVTTAAFEFIYVLEGSLKYQLEDRLFDMTTGDSLFFDGSIAHVPLNKSKKTVRLLVLYLFNEGK